MNTHHRLASLVLAMLVLTGCTSGKGSAPVTPSRVGVGGTLKVGMTGKVLFSLDPQDEWNTPTWELFRCCLVRTLMSYESSSGPGGTEPKPDLAAAYPDVSADGLTWTFHLRPGLHYGPPLQGVPITSPDIARAILRAGDPHGGNPFMGSFFLSTIAGFTEYATGKADTISGLETPDPLTLRVRETAPDATLPYRLSLPLTAPIPPSPSDPAAPFGVATGHDRSGDASVTDGYGPFLVSSGPYMIDGLDKVDFTQTPDQQKPASGLVPWTYRSNYDTVTSGSLTLVRNPSWDPGSDPLRLALPDRIEVEGGDPGPLSRQVASGDLAMVFDQTPSPDQVRHDLADPSLRPLVHSLDTGNVVLADFVLDQPPFDDVWARRAVAYALNRRAMVGTIRDTYGFGGTSVANHYGADVLEDALASGWSAFPNASGAPDLAAARRAMAASRYGDPAGRCIDPACRGVNVVLHGGLDNLVEPVRASLASLGIQANVAVDDDFYGACRDPARHEAMCLGNGWFLDYPSVGNLLLAEFGGPDITDSDNWTHMGASLDDLKRLKVPVRAVPSVDSQIRRCNEEVGASQALCWTRLDQYVIAQIMPTVPLAFGQVVRVSSPAIRSFAWDQGFQEPAIDRLSVAGG